MERCKKKALITATIGSFLGWFAVNDIKLLQKLGYEVHCACNMDFISTEERRKNLETSGAVIHHIPFSRNPLSADNRKSYCVLKRLIKKERYDLVHCHTPVGGVLTRAAVVNVAVDHMKVIYTAHGFHFYKGAPLQNWLFYYPLEWLCSWRTDVIITINQEDYRLAKRWFHAKKTVYMPGVGIDTEKFRTDFLNREKKRAELGLCNEDILLLSVGELNENKNHEIILRALKKLGNRYCYIVVGKGDRQKRLKELAGEFELEKKVKLVGYRSDVSDFYHAADIFVFPSLREGLPVSLMEAMAAGLPVVCSRIRGNTDLIDEGKGGYFFHPQKIDDAADCIKKIAEIDRKAFGTYNIEKVKKFDRRIIEKNMEKVYGEL